jgi:hypothetical protein
MFVALFTKVSQKALRPINRKRDAPGGTVYPANVSRFIPLVMPLSGGDSSMMGLIQPELGLSSDYWTKSGSLRQGHSAATPF